MIGVKKKDEGYYEARLYYFGNYSPQSSFTYSDLVKMYLWFDWSVAQRIFEFSEGVKIGNGAKMPKESINLLTESEYERTLWRSEESQKYLNVKYQT